MKFSTTLFPLLTGFVAASPTLDGDAQLDSRAANGPICDTFTTVVPWFCPTLGGRYPWCQSFFKLGKCLCDANELPRRRKLDCVDDFVKVLN
ncbi:hypothetical protein ED733_003313 [Metarhizium rileyi]|uniref:Extracellular membrane protein CFEM domain-containing protein n=1 Tax=Metarhizium rileyi (strain RCEF 4871) TaxID=1649241 RepID=A0A5C6G4I3_METRR|nr:hypothetical protein ED733_003313 [Metarhizium rileyi]